MQKNFLFILAISVFILGSDIISVPVNAQSSTFTVATHFEVEGTDIRKGMIVTNNGRSITIASTAYDPNIFGVITEKPAISLGQKNDGSNNYPVATTGKVPVLVTNANGEIKKGDYITSSTFRGIGMKATVPGRVLGIALENADVSGENTDLIMVSLNSETVSGDAIGALAGGGTEYNFSWFGTNREEPSFLSYVKFISSGLIAVISFTGGLVYYIQISKKEVEALGRNPLASQIIQKNMILHGIVVAIMCLGGLAMAYAVLQL